MKKSILFLLAIFSINLFLSQAKLADILYTNFEYSTAAKIYSESNNLSSDQVKNYAYSHYLNNNFQKSIPIFITSENELLSIKSSNRLKDIF